MRRILYVLLLLPALAGASDLVAERQYIEHLIQQAYLDYPAIPEGFLESQAFVATRWQHRIPDTAETHLGVPAVYGVFGLYGTDEGGFVDLVGKVAAFAGVSRDALLADQAVYVDAVAGFVDAEIRSRGLEGQPLEAVRPVAELLSGIQPSSDATRYAQTSHVYELYRSAGRGFVLDVVSVVPRNVDLTQVFTAAELERLQAKTLVFDASGQAVEVEASKKKSSVSFAAGSASTDQVNVDYPGATWNEAYYFSSRGAADITHVVIHTMQGSYAGSIAWFLNPDSNVSSHYLMRSSDGQITQMVRHVDKAWHARSANAYTIGIEHEGFVDNPDWYTDTLYEASAMLTAYICDMHTIDCSTAYDGPAHDTVVELTNDYTVKGHQHYADQAHTDPGIHWDWPRYHSLLNGGVSPPDVNWLPEATFVWECTGSTCSFDATASTDADGTITAWAWDFGDGSSATTSMPTHTFATAGDYDVRLAVTDDTGAVHSTLRNVRAFAPPLPPAPQKSGGGGAVGPWLLLVLLLFSACARDTSSRLEMPVLADADYYWIAAQIFHNETNSKLEYLTHWNDGEDFPSMGIGHFIWFPEGVDAPFDESFPAMLAYVREHVDACAPVPDWLRGPDVPAAPWPDKTAFDAAQREPRMVELREWLARTAALQARYIVSSFSERWNALDLAEGDKQALTVVLQALLQSPRGQFAVIDYFNFKGLGSNPRERYAGEGWGLVQVLREVAARAEPGHAGTVEQFAAAAADRLSLRVANSPPERGESRWLEGWHRRVAAYGDSSHAHESTAGNGFRVTPYLQDVTATTATISWFAEDASEGALILPESGEVTANLAPPRYACELAYHLAEFRHLDDARFPPWQQTATLSGLQPGSEYAIEIRQAGENAMVQVRTPAADRVHFVVYADSETEPESTGKRARWAKENAAEASRLYLVDQTEGYRANLAEISSKRPDFVAIAGDLVQSGGEQRDWDEFWRHNAHLAASVPIVPALGNHDYFGGPGDLGGFGPAGVARALAKFRTYFNRHAYYAYDSGPVTLVVLDTNNGSPERSANDTNWYLDNSAPSWQPGSPQWQWLESELARSQQEKAFTFVLFHPAPYTSGIHGRPPGVEAGENFSSGRPLQVLTPLFLRYGVDAVFNGHDEMYEHSIVRGVEQTGAGNEVDHAIHFMTVGIGGDGLRGPDPAVGNPHRVFLAHTDAPEYWSDDGVLLAGGKHYGHVDVQVGRNDAGTWEARLEPVYMFPEMGPDGEVSSFVARRYHDPVLLENARVD